MNKTTLIGIGIGLAGAIGGFLMDGAHLFLLWSTSSLIIVLGSTIGATILSFGMSEIKHTGKLFKKLFREEENDYFELIKQLEDQKFQALMQSFHSQVQGSGASLVFDYPGSAPSPTSSEDSTGLNNKSGAYPKREETDKETEKAKEVIVTERKKFEELQEKIQEYVNQKGIQKDVELRVDNKGLYLIMTGTILFENGKADLTFGAKRIVNDVFDILSTIDNPIRIEGHTDNNPIRTAHFPSNWELSSARAVNLLRYLIEEYKMDPSRLSAAAYGEYHPIAANDTPHNRAKNRRVEIVLLSKTLDKAN